MIVRVAVQNVGYKPWRSALLFLGFGFGVAVMIVLLAIGEAMVAQASDERLVGGGDVTVLPEGIDIEVMQTGGLGGLFFSIGNARFLYLQLLDSPRLSADVRAVAPQIDGRLMYLTAPNGATYPVRARGEIPSANRAVGAAPVVVAGTWADDAGDRRWSAPTAAELENAIDHFHLPPAPLADRAAWAEWHYFNVLSADRHHWAFITLMVVADVRQGPMRGEVLVTTQGDGVPPRRFVATVPSGAIRFSTTRADLTLGRSSVRVLSDGRYLVRARAHEVHGAAAVDVQLIITPTPRAYFPGGALPSSTVSSGYVVPALRAVASGTVCVNRDCEQFQGAQSYHDHNWGVWRGVAWEWGAARAGPYGILYGRVQSTDTATTPAPLFVYLVDSLGFRAVFRPEQIVYTDHRLVHIGGRTVRVPSRAVLTDVREGDTLRLELTMEDAIATDTRRTVRAPSSSSRIDPLLHPYFIQLKGTAHLGGRVQGEPLDASGTGFFETYR